MYFQATSQNPEKLHAFARNRVIKIQRLKKNAQIHHVPGALNTADLVSRGCDYKQFAESEWLTGPSFIRKPEAFWPTLSVGEAIGITTNMARVEAAPFPSFVIERPQPADDVQVYFTENPIRDIAMNVVLRFDTQSRWAIYLRSVVRFRRAVDFFKGRIKKKQLSIPILQKELREAEIFIIKEVQKDSYKDELRLLMNGSVVPKGSTIRVLKPFLHNDLISLGGRLGANLGELPKHPVILPPKHKVTRMILRDVHERSCHAGPSQVLIEARHRYWIPQGKKLIQNIIHGCKECWRYHTKPASASMGEPPEVRVSRSQPFEHVGTDILGPLYVKTSDKNSRKIWIVIYTCCAMRAIHLEILQSLTTTELLMSLRRFKARRGCPRTFYSDNAKAYKRAAGDLKTLCELMKDVNVQEHLAREGIDWKFSVERAPWYMGFTERLVGSVKSALKKVLGKTAVTEQEMLTVLCEIESSINRRPLCNVPESEHIDVLTPLHFLINRTEDPTQDSTAPAKIRATDLLKRWRHKKTLVESVWKRWEHEYLLLLRNFHETVPRDLRTLKVGQVVIIKDANKPKMLWRLGRVEKLNMGRDGGIRSCFLKTTSGQLMQRAINHLYPLEVSE